MKRFTRICTVFGGILLILGLVLAAAGYLMGAVGDIRVANQAPAREQKEHVISANGMESLEVTAFSEDIRVEPSEDRDVHIRYTPREGWGYPITETKTAKGTTRVQFAATPPDHPSSHLVFFVSEPNPDIVILLPKDYDGALTVSTLSGDITLSSVSAGDCILSSTSGELDLTEVSAGKLQAKSTSGDLDISQAEIQDALQLTSTSGDLELAAVSAAEIACTTTSGDIRLSGCRSGNTPRLQTTSGDIRED